MHFNKVEKQSISVNELLSEQPFPFLYNEMALKSYALYETLYNKSLKVVTGVRFGGRFEVLGLNNYC